MIWDHMITFESLRLFKAMIGCLLDYLWFKGHYKLIAIDLSTWRALDADPKAIQKKLYWKSNLRWKHNSIFQEEARETILDFSQGTVRAM